jgi:hypothetical protein
MIVWRIFAGDDPLAQVIESAAQAPMDMRSCWNLASSLSIKVALAKSGRPSRRGYSAPQAAQATLAAVQSRPLRQRGHRRRGRRRSAGSAWIGEVNPFSIIAVIKASSCPTASGFRPACRRAGFCNSHRVVLVCSPFARSMGSASV